MKLIKKIRKLLKKWGVLVLSVTVLILIASIYNARGKILPAKTERGFDEFGYNNTARIFNGTGYGWCAGKYGWTAEQCEGYLGIYAGDKIVMKWNAEWDRGNADGWKSPPYKAWTDNEWNGMKGGSGSVWHYKISWYGPCTEGATFPEGGYCIWGQFKVLMDQGTLPEGGHEWWAKSTPAGYGAR